MTTTIIWTIAILTVLGAALAVVLYFVAEKFKVEEDPRIDEVEKVLPGANCGGCGQAGCRAFAQFCVESSPNLDKCFCPVGGNEGMQKVAAVLGVEVAAKEPMVAVVRCNGSCENRPRTNEYGGYQSCRVKAALYSGDTGCSFGCLGCGDCVAACQFGAIEMDPETGLPVVDEEKCTACGACVKACPKNVIELRNKGRRNMRVYVSCINKDKGAAARKACKAAPKPPMTSTHLSVFRFPFSVLPSASSSDALFAALPWCVARKRHRTIAPTTCIALRRL